MSLANGIDPVGALNVMSYLFFFFFHKKFPRGGVLLLTQFRIWTTGAGVYE